MLPFYLVVLRILPDSSTSPLAVPSEGASFPSDPSSPSTQPSKFSFPTLYLIFRRTLTFFIDYILIAYVSRWPYTFFFADPRTSPGNPVVWRWKTGFREYEPVLRVSRRWGAEDLRYGSTSGTSSTKNAVNGVAAAGRSKTDARSKNLANRKGYGGIKGAESPYFDTRIASAVDRTYLRGTTGYMMMGQHWDLDFAGMAHVVELLDAGEMELDHCRTVVLVFERDEEPKLGSKAGGDDEPEFAGGRWLAWRVFNSSEAKREDEDEGEERRRISGYKEKLQSLGKEDLFFRWVELVQYEMSRSKDTASDDTKDETISNANSANDKNKSSNKPNHDPTTLPTPSDTTTSEIPTCATLTPDKEESLRRKIEQLFREHGLDFDEFVNAVSRSEESEGGKMGGGK